MVSQGCQGCEPPTRTDPTAHSATLPTKTEPHPGPPDEHEPHLETNLVVLPLSRRTAPLARPASSYPRCHVLCPSRASQADARRPRTTPRSHRLHRRGSLPPLLQRLCRTLPRPRRPHTRRGTCHGESSCLQWVRGLRSRLPVSCQPHPSRATSRGHAKGQWQWIGGPQKGQRPGRGGAIRRPGVEKIVQRQGQGGR
jgi:hypothetical protein